MALLLSLFLVPLVMAGIIWLVPSERWRPWLLPLTGLAHLVLSCQAIWGPSVSSPENWLYLDPLGKIVLFLIGLLFLGCALYAPGYLALRSERSNRTLCAGLLISLAM